MKTLQIGDDWPEERVGGLNRYFVELLRALPQTGTQVHGLVVGSPAISGETHGTVVPFARATASLPARLWLARQAATRQIRLHSVDLIAAHFALYAAPLASSARDLPLVVHFHGPWAAESDVEGSASLNLRLKLALEGGVYRRAQRLIVLSHAFRQELVRRYHVAEERVHVVPGGIDLHRFNCNLSRAEARQHLSWPQDRLIVLSVRRLVRRMGLEMLIDAIVEARRRRPEVLLLLGGSGPLQMELEQRLRDKGLEQHVQLLGRISEEDLPLAYRAADVSVVPSQTLEGFGLITLESLASGTPVMVTPVGGLPEILQPLDPRCIFADTSTRAISAELTEVLEGSRPLPTPEACRAYAVEHYSWTHVAQQVTEVYGLASA